MDFNFEIDPDAPGIAYFMIALVIVLFLVLAAWHFGTWYLTIASNHTATVCIGRGVC